MKNKLFLMGILSMLSLNNQASPSHCLATFQNQPFAQVVTANMDKISPAKCYYGQDIYHKMINYDVGLISIISGPWKSDMPGYRFCQLRSGGTFDKCLFEIH